MRRSRHYTQKTGVHGRITDAEISFDLLFDLPTVAAGPSSTSGSRVKAGPQVTPLAIGQLQGVLADTLRAMLAPHSAAAIKRASGDTRNVRRYREPPLALTAVMVSSGGYLYAFFGLPYVDHPSINTKPEFDPVVWLGNCERIPNSPAAAHRDGASRGSLQRPSDRSCPMN